METGSVAVTTLNRARRTKRRYDAVITIEDPGQRNPLRFHVSPHPEHLVMKFEDVDFRAQGIALPCQEHVAAAVKFGRRHPEGSILVHCKAGIARSTALALAIIAGLVVYYRRVPGPSRLLGLCLGLLVGGALGNLIDRWRLGHVVDFVAVGIWPRFNLADVAVTLGVAILAWHVVVEERASKPNTQTGPCR